MKIVPDTTLEEDDNQGEMDVIFFVSLVTYTIYLCLIDIIYPDPVHLKQVGDFNLVMSNLWAFFPVMQAQGLWLKGLLIGTMYYSICWHWTNVGMDLPHGKDYYRKFDAIFSVCIILAYALSWFPDCKYYQPTKKQERKYCWYRNCRGRPRETAEWRCRWTPRLIFIVFSCICVGTFMYYDNNMNVRLFVSWTSIALALILSLFQLYLKKMSVSRKNRIKFAVWAAIGVVFGCIGFAYKMKSNENDKYKYFNHSVWHAYVMSCAYSFSRASEYLEIY